LVVLGQSKPIVTIRLTDDGSDKIQYFSNDSTGFKKMTDHLNDIMMEGHLHSYIDTVRKDTLIEAKIIRGPRILPDSVHWSYSSSSNIQSFQNQTLMPLRINDWKELRNTIEEQLTWGEDHGYPFASVQTTGLSKSLDSTLTLELLLEPGPLIQYDSLFVVSSQAIPTKYIRRYLGILGGDHYNESELNELEIRLQEIPFIQTVRPIEVRFWQNKADIKVFVKRKGANYFNAILGIRPDDKTGKVNFTGDVEVRLLNAFNRGEELELNWRKMQTQTQDLFVQAEVPYWFGGPIGTETSLKIYKRDSTFTDVKGRYGLMLQLERLNRISVFIEQQKISNLSVTNFAGTNNAFRNSRLLLYGARARWLNLDYRFNPRRGYELDIEVSTGRRTVVSGETKTNAAIYDIVRYRAAVAYYIPTFKKQTLRLGFLGQGVSSGELETAELLRLGGLRTIRGVDEESINTTQFMVSSLEYRWLFERNGALYAFVDQGWYERNADPGYLNDFPRSYGVGINFETKSGIFTFNYALGKQFDNPVQIRNAKISFGFRNVF
jgi:outer membrane protein assembly factor BamA